MKYINRSILITTLILIVIFLTISVLALLKSISIVKATQQEIKVVFTSIESKNYDRAITTLLTLEESLKSAKAYQQPSKWIQLIPIIRTNYIIYDELLEAGMQLTISFKKIVQTLSESSISTQISLQTLNLKTLPSIYLQEHDNITTAFEHLLEAAERARNLDYTILPKRYHADVLKIQKQLLTYEDQVREYLPYLKVLPNILGETQPNDVLFILQNQDELRPTGGFIGTYGKVSINHGTPENFFTDDVYNLDVKALGREQLEAPSPIQEYTTTKYWYLRDANWSPDYPTVAKNIKTLYEFESGDTDIDTIIAVTPNLIKRYLEITGPIEVDNIVFTSENLVDALQYRVEQEFWRIGLTNEQRKSVINNLAQILMQKIWVMEPNELKQLKLSFFQALDHKEILVYSTNPDVQKFVLEHGWAGEINREKNDYIYVVDANLGALKTDRLMSRNRQYKIVKQEDGTLLANLKLTYTNHGHFDYRTTRYRTYTRIYLPIGSEVIKSSGFVKTDKSSVFVDPIIYSEFDKAVVAGFISIEPGQSRYIEIQYLLPPWLNTLIESEGKYSLTIQKQPGISSYTFNGEFHGEKNLFSFAPSSVDYKLLSEKAIQYTDTVFKDQKYVINFK